MTRSRVVKVRVTEAEYSDWTEMALRGSVSLSETIRRAMQGNPQPESPKPLESLPDDVWEAAQDPLHTHPLLIAEQAQLQGARIDAWAEKARRKEPCPHGKPGFAFCPECDS